MLGVLLDGRGGSCSPPMGLVVLVWAWCGARGAAMGLF